jgi:hypothetical protein
MTKQSELDRSMAKFHKGFQQNVKGANQADFIEQFLAALPPQLAKFVEQAAVDLFAIENLKRFRRKYIVMIASAYSNGMELQKEGHGFDVVKIISRIENERYERTKAGKI